VQEQVRHYDELVTEQVFEYRAKTPALMGADAVRLRPTDPPGPGAAWSTRARPVLLAVRGGGWVAARVLAWTWNPDPGQPVEWRCAVDLGGGTVDWLAYDCRLMRPVVPGR
jgi:hypothetical protein